MIPKLRSQITELKKSQPLLKEKDIAIEELMLQIDEGEESREMAENLTHKQIGRAHV